MLNTPELLCKGAGEDRASNHSSSVSNASNIAWNRDWTWVGRHGKDLQVP